VQRVGIEFIHYSYPLWQSWYDPISFEISQCLKKWVALSKVIMFTTVLTSSDEILVCCFVFPQVCACHVMTLHVHSYTDFTWLSNQCWHAILWILHVHSYCNFTWVTNQSCIPRLWPYKFIATLILHDQPVLAGHVVTWRIHSYTDFTWQPNQSLHAMLNLTYPQLHWLHMTGQPILACYVKPYISTATMTSHDSPTNPCMLC